MTPESLAALASHGHGKFAAASALDVTKKWPNGRREPRSGPWRATERLAWRSEHPGEAREATMRRKTWRRWSFDWVEVAADAVEALVTAILNAIRW